MTRNFDYWKNKNVYGPNPSPFFGNLKEYLTLKTPLGFCFKQLYDSSKEPIVGIFFLDEPAILIRSPEIAKCIMAKDCNYFKDRISAISNKGNMFSSALFFQKSPEWNRTRPQISPAFSPSNIKNLLPELRDIASEMTEYICDLKNNHDAKSISDKYAIESIARLLSLKAGCFKKSDSEIFQFCREIFEFTFLNGVRHGTYFLKPGLADILHIELISKSGIQFIRNVFWNIVRTREKENIRVNDLIGTLLDIRRKDSNFGNYNFEFFLYKINRK